MRIILGFILVFFGFGVGWGVWQQSQRQRALTQAAPLKVLCAEGWLSDEILREFSREHNVPIQHITYSRPLELVQQLANADGKVDLVCSSSLVLSSLAANHWIQRMDFSKLKNLADLHVDFLRLGPNRDGDLGVPMLWNLYGFVAKSVKRPFSWRAAAKDKALWLWNDDLNVLNLLGQFGVSVQEHLEMPDAKSFAEDVRQFMAIVQKMIGPKLPETRPTFERELVQMPLAQAAEWLEQDSSLKFELPEEGAALEVGLLSVGGKSEQTELSLLLMDQILSSESGLRLHERMHAGVVHRSLNNLESIPRLRRPQALREFPLDRIKFPEVDIEGLPRLASALQRN